MARLPALPKVSYDWSVEGRRTRAKCRLCHAFFYGTSRNDIYPSTSRHKETCPKYVEAKRARRRLELEALS